MTTETQSQPQTQQLEHYDSCFQVISSFLDALQKNFKMDTQYSYPLMPPQANILFALDQEAAEKMKGYIQQLMLQECGFGDEEYRLGIRMPQEIGGLSKIRLEFNDGLTLDLLRKISDSTNSLEQRITQHKMAQ